MKFSTTAGAVLLYFFATNVLGMKLETDNADSIRAASKQYANGLMSLYTGNAPGTPEAEIGIWPQPHYWWEGGAAWGGMVEYTQFTKDSSHVKTLQQALTANYGPKNDFILDSKKGQTGNDDQAFWALAVMSALEYQFPDPADAPASYLEVATNAFENIVGRWDETSCGGGLKWQIYPENAYGYNYKNAISNGCTFALGARLARYTGEQKYADWAVKIYDWTKKVGLITEKFEVFDGTDDKKNCATVADETQWTYNNAMYLHGSAFMYDVTNGASVWKDRTAGFLKHAELLFFKPFENSTDVMYEWACETGESGRHCNLDQQSFKAYFSRFLAKTAMMAPFTKNTITKYLEASAAGAAKACSGGADGSTCGSKWYTGGWDGTSGVGQQLSALEVTQSLLMLKDGMMPTKKDGAQQPQQPEQPQQPAPSSSPAPPPAPKPSTTTTEPAKDQPEVTSQVLPTFTLSEQSSTSTPLPTVIAPSIIATAPAGSCTCSPKLVTVTVPYGSTPSTSCTPSVTTTVYVPPSVGTAVPAIPPVNGTVPFNGTSTFPPLPEFTGAAQKLGMGLSVIGAAVACVLVL